MINSVKRIGTNNLINSVKRIGTNNLVERKSCCSITKLQKSMCCI